MERTRFAFAPTRFTLERFATFRFVLLPFVLAICSPSVWDQSLAALSCAVKNVGGNFVPAHSSQSLSRIFLGRYSSVMKLIPRRERASSSNFCSDFTISWISCCHFVAWNHG